MTSIRGRIWFFLISFFRKRMEGPGGSLLKVTTSENSFSNSKYWKRYKNFNISEKLFNSIKVIEFDLKNKNNKNIILYLHGGGYVTCGPETHSTLVTQISEYSGVKTLFPVYRLAPKYPFPAAIEDCLMVYKELLKKGINSKNISLIGDSAGGGLVMALLQILQREKIDQPSSSVLISPWTDLTLSGGSIISRADRDPMIKPGKDVDEVIKAYLGNEDPKNPLISPIYSETFTVPPMQIYVGTEEILYDDSIRIFEKLSKDENNNLELKIYDGMFHVFNIFCRGLLTIPEAKKANRDIANFILENYPKK